MKAPRTNCLFWSISFKLRHRKAKIKVYWNKQSKVPSFRIHYNQQEYRLRRINRKQSKFFYHGKVTKTTKTL